jgi:competence protein ComEC
VPALYSRLFLVQVTILPLPIKPAIVIQQQGHTVLVNGDERDDFKYRVLPFLSQQGINQLDGVVATNFASISLPIQNYLDPVKIPLGKSINIGKVTLEVLSHQVALVQFHLNHRTWLWLGKAQANIPEDLVGDQLIESPEVLLWSGGDLHPDWFNLIKPQMAIASSKFVSPSLRRYLERENIPWYWTKRDGALQWNEKTGLKATITEDID